MLARNDHRNGKRLETIIMSTFAVLVVLALSVILLLDTYVSDSLRTAQYSTEHWLSAEVEAIENMLDPTEFDGFRTIDDAAKPRYRELSSELRAYAETHDLVYIYVFREVNTTGGRGLQYILDSDPDSKTHYGLDEVQFGINRTVSRALAGEIVFDSIGEYELGWKGLISAYSPVFDDSGKVLAVIGVDIRDEDIAVNRAKADLLSLASVVIVVCLSATSLLMVSLLRRKVKETKKLGEEAQNANQAKTDFLANTSHEIRTSLNAILGLTKIMIQRDDISPETKETIAKIYNAAYLQLHLINDILDVSKIESGSFELVPSEYNVASFLSDVVQLNRIYIGDKDIKFTLHVGKTVPSMLFGDGLRIRQVLNNLISNAFKYTKSGTVELRISVKPSIDDNITLVLRVTDTGQGMSEEQVEQLFDKFARFNAEQNQHIQGTGLGMAITRYLVDLMEGDIFVESELGKGTNITIELPQQTKDGGTPLAPEFIEKLTNFDFAELTQGRNVEIAYTRMAGKRVLIVDDVDINLEVAEGLLTPYMLHIDTATSGAKAIDLVLNQKNTYDIIFMDHMMPEMDGLQALGILREAGYTGPIVALTANAMAGQEDMYLEQGFDGFLSKPIDTRQMDDVLRRFIPEDT